MNIVLHTHPHTLSLPVRASKLFCPDSVASFNSVEHVCSKIWSSYGAAIKNTAPYRNYRYCSHTGTVIQATCEFGWYHFAACVNLACTVGTCRLCSRHAQRFARLRRKTCEQQMRLVTTSMFVLKLCLLGFAAGSQEPKRRTEAGQAADPSA